MDIRKAIRALLSEEPSQQQMEERLRGIWALVQRGATEGERDGARLAYDRVKATIIARFGQKAFDDMERRIKGGSQQSYKQPPPKQEPKPEPKPEPRKYGDSHAYHHNGKTLYLWRFVDPDAGVKGSNKVWGYFMKVPIVSSAPNVVIWGGFGKTLSRQQVMDSECRRKSREKENKGYRRVMANEINAVDYGWLLTQL